MKILMALQQDGRMSFTELAKQAGLSLPATIERVNRLEDAGVIQGYGARINRAALGYPISALIGITTPEPHKKKLLETLKGCHEVIECHHVTGADSYVIKVSFTSIAHLETFVATINRFGETRTSIVMSSAIDAKPFAPSQTV
jgi:Lrp/AsnC family leucine-responsive transcriptional regulator